MAESSPTSSIFDSLLQQVQSYSPTIESVEVGYVEEVGDGIARDQQPPPGAHVPAGAHVLVRFTR